MDGGVKLFSDLHGLPGSRVGVQRRGLFARIAGKGRKASGSIVQDKTRYETQNEIPSKAQARPEHGAAGQMGGETKQQERAHHRSIKDIGLSEEWLFTTLQSIGDAVIATDAAGRVVFMNTVAVQLTGWSAEDAQGRDCREVFYIINAGTRDSSESPVDKVMRDGHIAGLGNHTILIAKDGTERSIDDSGSPIRDSEGALTGVVLIFRDITGRRKAELTMAEQEHILQSLLDHLPVIVTFSDESGQFTWVNREWTRVMGWSVEEMGNRPRQQSLAPLAPPATGTPNASQQAPTAAPKPLLGWRSVKMRCKAGAMLDLSWATIRLSDGTGVGIGQDMTPRPAREEATEQRLAASEAHNRRLQQAMQETDHRVKNNLQSISALLDIQLMDHAEAVPARELMQIRMHIKTLASIHAMLIRDVKQAGVPTSLSVQAELEQLMPMLQQIVGTQRIEWKVEDVRLPVKQGMSLAVLVNELVGNAVKHGGQKVQMQIVVLDKNVKLEVCDDGPGFGESFDPKRSANYGLELVESVGRLDLGGQTAYANRPGGGACVQVTFPLPALQTV